jgi:general secretion pathway protein C
MGLVSFLRSGVWVRWLLIFVFCSCPVLLVWRAVNRVRAARTQCHASDRAEARPVGAPPPAPVAPPATGPVHATRADAILQRNPFDSVTGPLGRADHGYPRVTETICPNIDLVRVVLSENPAWSFAEIASGAQRTLLTPGRALNGRRLVAVEAGRVRMESKDSACVAFLDGSTNVSSPACVASGFRLRPPCILRLSDTVFDVAAAMVDHVLEDQAELMRCARVVPEQDEHGKITGVRLFGIRPGSLMAALGFENGDTLHTVNGFDMTSPDRALEAYSKLRSASDLSVGISRKGKKMVLEYHLR